MEHCLLTRTLTFTATSRAKVNCGMSGFFSQLLFLFCLHAFFSVSLPSLSVYISFNLKFCFFSVCIYQLVFSVSPFSFLPLLTLSLFLFLSAYTLSSPSLSLSPCLCLSLSMIGNGFFLLCVLQAQAVQRWLSHQEYSVGSELPEAQGVWDCDETVNISNTYT